MMEKSAKLLRTPKGNNANVPSWNTERGVPYGYLTV